MSLDIQLIPEVRWANFIVGSSDDVYPMQSYPRGPCLIINNMLFTDLNQRDWTWPDSARLAHIFEMFHFRVTQRKNQTAKEMREEVRILAEDDETNSKADALVIVIMSHGFEGGILGTAYHCTKNPDDKLYHHEIVEMLNNINCPLLKGKPKMCFFQACQGGKQSLPSEDGDEILPTRTVPNFPEASDFLLSFASQEGFTTVKFEGTIGIYATRLAEVLAEYAHDRDLQDMLTIVERKVRNTPAMAPYREPAVGQRTLTGKLLQDNVDLCLSTSVKLLGWSRKLYFNPAHKDAELFNVPRLHMIYSLSKGTPPTSSDEIRVTEKNSLEERKVRYRSKNVYRVSASPRGPCLIINNITFSDGEMRHGADEDERRLTKVFGYLKFNVTVLRNLTTEEMQDALHKFSMNTDNEVADAAVIVIMSHGDEDVLFGVDGFTVGLSYRQIVKQLNNRNCPKLRHKPKLFFLQGCSGDKLPIGVEDSFVEAARQSTRPMLPECSDVLLSFAAQEGYYTFRNTSLGSYYATHLADVLTAYAEEWEIMEILHEVESRMRETNISFPHDHKRMCMSTSLKLLGWSRKLYLGPLPQDGVVVGIQGEMESGGYSPRLYVIGGGSDPEILSTNGSRWEAKQDAHLRSDHGVVSNSDFQMAIYSDRSVFLCRTKCVERWNVDEGSLYASINLKMDCEKAAIAFHDGDIFMMGADASTCCRIYSIRTRKISGIIPLTRSTSGKNAAVLNDKIYLTPGKEKEPLDELTVFDPKVRCWSTVSGRMSARRFGHTLSACKTYLWVFGGCDGLKCLKEVERYDPATDAWQRMCPMNQARKNCSVAYFQGKFYVTGGVSYVPGTAQEEEPLSTVEIYNPGTNTWDLGPSMLSPRTGHSSFVL